MSTTATKTTAPTTARRPRANPEAFEVQGSDETTSQALARLVTNSATSAITLKRFADASDSLEIPDLVTAMRQAGDEAVAGDLGRVERMLANQLLTLDVMFNNLAQRAGRQESFKAIEIMMRLALKAQSQARATAETLGVLKNPMPYIKQANMATGPQQVVNNTYANTSARGCIQSGAGNFQTEPNELLEQAHGQQRLDTGAPGAAGRTDQKLEAVAAVNRPNKRRGQGAGKS